MSKTSGNCPTLVIARALNPGGIGLVHTIGCSEARNEHDLFIQKYIFRVLNQPRAFGNRGEHGEAGPGDSRR